MTYDYRENEIIDLSQLDDAFQNAPTETTFEAIPDGTYQVRVERVELTTAKISGAPMLKWTLRIISPSHAGRMLWKHGTISHDNIKWIKKDLHICGLDLPKLSDLPAHLEKLLDVKLEIRKKTDGDFENIYFQRVIEIGIPKMEDELPF